MLLHAEPDPNLANSEISLFFGNISYKHKTKAAKPDELDAKPEAVGKLFVLFIKKCP